MKVIAFSGVPGAGKDTAAKIIQDYDRKTEILKFAHPLQDVVSILMGAFDKESLKEMRNMFDNHEWKNNRIIDFSLIRNYESIRHITFSMIANMLCGELKQTLLPYAYLTVPLAKPVPVSKQGVASLDELTDIQEVLFSASAIYSLLQEHFLPVFSEDRLFSPREVQQLFGTELCRKYISPLIWVSILERSLTLIEDSKTVLITDLRFLDEQANLIKWGTKFVTIVNSAAQVKAHEQGILSHSSEFERLVIAEQADYVLTNNMEGLDSYKEDVIRMYTTLSLDAEFI